MKRTKHNTESSNIDRPLRSASEDRLDRRQFVRNLADRLVRDGKGTGLVVGLNGPWGAGKTSILNLLEGELELHQRYRQPLVVRFNPWLISTREDLISAFFATLTNSLREKLGYYDVYDSGRDQTYDKAIKGISKYAESLSPVFNYLVPASGSGIRFISKFLADKISTSESIHSLKSNVESSLKKFDFAIVVLIDELDRIVDSEIRLIAQLIRSIAEFDNVSYVVAYDEMRVMQSLGEGNDEAAQSRGRSFLDKIINVNVHLPLPEGSQISSILADDVLSIIRDYDIRLSDFNEKRLYEIIQNITPHPISTTRDIRRLLSDYESRLLEFASEIDPIDIFGWAILALKGHNTVSGIQSYIRGSSNVLGFRNVGEWQSQNEAWGTSFQGATALGLSDKQGWIETVVKHVWAVDVGETPLAEISDERLAIAPTLAKFLNHNIRTKGPSQRQLRRVSRQLNAGDFAAVKRLSSLDECREHAGNLDQFADQFDELGIRRFISFSGHEIEGMYGRKATTSISPSELLRFCSMIDRLVRRRADLDVDLPGVLVRLIESGMYQLPLGMIVNDEFRDSASIYLREIARSSLPIETLVNLSVLLLRRAAISLDLVPNPLIVGLWSSQLDGAGFSHQDFRSLLKRWVKEQNFAREVISLIFRKAPSRIFPTGAPDRGQFSRNFGILFSDIFADDGLFDERFLQSQAMGDFRAFRESLPHI